MATLNPVGPDTPVTVKVTFGGENRRFKLPLKDLGPGTFDRKLATLLAVPYHQNLFLERYSDSAASFVVLAPNNTQVYKQLYRAAKAKGKLRIRATLVDDGPPPPVAAAEPPPMTEYLNGPFGLKATPQEAPVPLENPSEPFTISGTPSLYLGKYMAATAEPPTVPPTEAAEPVVKTEPADLPPKYEPVAKDLTSMQQQFQRLCSLNEELQQHRERKQALYGKLGKLPETGPRRAKSIPVLTMPNGSKVSLSSDAKTLLGGGDDEAKPSTGSLGEEDARPTPAWAPALHHGLTQFSVCCNICSADIPRVHWHCSICQDGDYDLCAACVDLGHHCEVDSHFLIKRIIEKGKVINATHETISKKFGHFTDSKPAEIADPWPELGHRTCNNCIGVFEDHKFVMCTACTDYDLCVPCHLAQNHGHHPGHAFVPVDDKLELGTRAMALCEAGRNKYHHAICDGCDKKIRGLRHKCFECPDFDYCDACVKHAKRTHPSHRFAPLYDTITVPQTVAAEHAGVTCDGPMCQRKSPRYIQGVRYKCAVCHDFDLCAACEALPVNGHNRTHPLLKFRTPVARVSVTTYDEQADQAAPLGDRPVATSSKATETTAPVNAATGVQTVAEFKPLERAKEAAKLESQRGSPGPVLDGHFVSDVIPDGSKLPAAQVFCQTWTIQNPGPGAWPAGCCLRFVGGDRMLNMDAENPASTDDLDRAISSNVIDREVAVGEHVQFAVVLKAPVRPGKAISYWRIKTPEGQAFGHKLWCEIDVTAPPSQPPSPTVAAPLPHAEVATLTTQLQSKTDEIARVSAAMKTLQDQLAVAELDKATALRVAELQMAGQRAELLARLDAAAAATERLQASQMIFPTLDKESPAASQVAFTKASPEASVYETARSEPLPAEPTAAGAEAALVEDLETLTVADDESTDDGFLTDEEYEILDHEFEEIAPALH